MQAKVLTPSCLRFRLVVLSLINSLRQAYDQLIRPRILYAERTVLSLNLDKNRLAGRDRRGQCLRGNSRRDAAGKLYERVAEKREQVQFQVAASQGRFGGREGSGLRGREAEPVIIILAGGEPSNVLAGNRHRRVDVQGTEILGRVRGSI